MKFTIANVERKQVWNNKTGAFEIRDLLPVGVSADHRVYDGNLGTKKMCQIAFDEVLYKFEQEKSEEQRPRRYSDIDKFIRFTDNALADNLEFCFRFLMFSSQIWNNGIELDDLYKKLTSPSRIFNKVKRSFTANT